MLLRRAVASAEDALVKSGRGPVFGAGLSWYPLVPPFAEERGSRMVDVFHAVIKVGTPTEAGHEVSRGNWLVGYYA